MKLILSWNTQVNPYQQGHLQWFLYFCFAHIIQYNYVPTQAQLYYYHIILAVTEKIFLVLSILLWG